MASPQCTVPASCPAPARLAAVRPAAARRHVLRATPRGGRFPQSGSPTTRRNGGRPGARPARLDGVASARPVRGGCAPEPAGRPVVCAEAYGRSTPLQLTRRGRRVLSALSIAIGLSIAVLTVAVELGRSDGGLQPAASSTVVVHSGDTLWTLALELAPEEDPRAVVDALVEVNGLDGVELVPGMVLRVP